MNVWPFGRISLRRGVEPSAINAALREIMATLRPSPPYFWLGEAAEEHHNN